jgi:hypothetical protein
LTRNGKHFVVLNADDHPGQEAAPRLTEIILD